MAADLHPGPAACAFHYGRPMSGCPSCMAAQGAVGAIRCYDDAGNEVGTYVEGGPGRVRLIAMNDGTVRWAK